MSYRLKHSDASLQQALRRIAIEQIGKAIEEVDDDRLDPHATVHAVRKRCKRLRGLIRLVRPVFADYDAENAAFRDAAGMLSFLRDSRMLIGVYDALADRYGDEIDRPALAPIRRRLTLRQKQAGNEHDVQRSLARFRDGMEQARGRARRWRLDADGFEAVAGGLARTYKRARRAMEEARADPTADAFHEWRKRAKYHGYHARLLTPLWPAPMKAHRNGAERLADLLGDHHDLAVFQDALAADPDAFGKPADLRVMHDLIGRRQAALETEAFALGDRLQAEPAKTLIGRWGAYWTAWRSAGRGTGKGRLAA